MQMKFYSITVYEINQEVVFKCNGCWFRANVCVRHATDICLSNVDFEFLVIFGVKSGSIVLCLFM